MFSCLPPRTPAFLLCEPGGSQPGLLPTRGAGVCCCHTRPLRRLAWTPGRASAPSCPGLSLLPLPLSMKSRLRMSAAPLPLCPPPTGPPAGWEGHGEEGQHHAAGRAPGHGPACFNRRPACPTGLVSPEPGDPQPQQPAAGTAAWCPLPQQCDNIVRNYCHCSWCCVLDLITCNSQIACRGQE